MRRLKIKHPSLKQGEMQAALLSAESLAVSASKVKKLARTAYHGLAARTDSGEDSRPNRRRAPLSQSGIQTAEALEHRRKDLARKGVDLSDTQTLKHVAAEQLLPAFEAAARGDYESAAACKQEWEKPGAMPTVAELHESSEWFRSHSHEYHLAMIHSIQIKKRVAPEPKVLAKLAKAYPREV